MDPPPLAAIALAGLAALAAACNGQIAEPLAEDTPMSDADGRAVPATPPSTPSPLPSSPEPAKPAPVESDCCNSGSARARTCGGSAHPVCPACACYTRTCEGTLAEGADVHITATGLAPWNGLRAHVLAVEPQNVPGKRVFPLRISIDVVGGGLEETCSSAINANSRSPGMVLLIDIDGDGTCSPGDLFAEDVRFSWGQLPGADVERFRFDGTELHPVGDTWGSYWWPDVCKLFGPTLESTPPQ